MEDQTNPNPIPEPLTQSGVLPTGINTEPFTPPLPTSPVEITPPVEPEKPKSKLIPVLVAVLILVALGAVGVWAYQTYFVQTPVTEIISSPVPTATLDPTANWETYINNENGYSIKFPKSDFVRINCIGEELIAEKFGIPRASPMTAIACERDSRYDLETKTYTSIQSEPEETKYYNTVKKDVQIGGILGKLYINTFTEIEDGPYPKWYAIARVNKNNKTYEIYFDDKSKLDLFNQILSTFQFTK